MNLMLKQLGGKKITFENNWAIILSITLLTLITSCAPFTPIYDQYSYQKATEIKVLANQLMDKANKPYEQNLEEITKLYAELEIIKEYEKNRPNNVISYAMWQVLTNKDRYLLVGFFEYWEKKGQLSEVFIEEAEEQINYAMGLLFNYELLKNRESENAIQKYINTP